MKSLDKAKVDAQMLNCIKQAVGRAKFLNFSGHYNFMGMFLNSVGVPDFYLEDNDTIAWFTPRHYDLEVFLESSPEEYYDLWVQSDGFVYLEALMNDGWGLDELWIPYLEPDEPLPPLSSIREGIIPKYEPHKEEPSESEDGEQLTLF